jgi:hypothetical protein
VGPTDTCSTAPEIEVYREDHEEAASPLRFVDVWGGRIVGRLISVRA